MPFRKSRSNPIHFFLLLYFLSITAVGAFGQDSPEPIPIGPINTPLEETVLDSLAAERFDRCSEVSYFGFPAYAWSLPDSANGDSAFSMKFDAIPTDTVKLVEFMVFDFSGGTNFGDDDIYITIRDDSSGYPSTVLYTDTLEAGTYQQWPNWTSVSMGVEVLGNFHVVLATSAPVSSGRFEFIVSDDGSGTESYRLLATGSYSWNNPEKWYPFPSPFDINFNLVMRALVCGSQYADCVNQSCNVSSGRVQRLPTSNGIYMQAQRFEGTLDTCKLREVGIELIWPLADTALPLYTDSAAVHLFDDSSGLPGTKLASITIHVIELADLGLMAGFSSKILSVDFGPFNIEQLGPYWIGVESFAPDSTTGLRLLSDVGGGGCDYGYVSNSGNWTFVADDYGLPTDAALSLLSQYCCFHSTLINVPDDFETIQEAINYAFEDDTIIVAPGTYFENINFLGKPITVASEFFLTGDTSLINQTIIDAQGSGHVVNISSGEGPESKLIGFTIQNGQSLNGGGIYCIDSDPFIGNCKIINNFSGSRGGGIYCFFSDATIDNCIISNNQGGFGGGLASYSDGVNVSNSIITNNSSEYGGGFYGYIDQSIFDNTIILKNTSLYGGAIYLHWSDIIMNNSTIAANITSTSGTIHLYQSLITIGKSIIAFNNSTSSVWVCENPPNSITVSCSNIFGNSSGDWDLCNGQSLPPGNNFSIDPLFCNWVEGDLQLNQFSPFADSNSTCGQIGALGVGCSYLCGDADGDSALTVNDINFIRQYYFECNEAPYYYSAGDANCDGKIDLADVLYLSEHILSGGPAPCCP